MNIKIIRLFIVLSVFAVIGLIAVQVYWINDALELKEAQFEKDVHIALNDVVTKLERMEIAERISSHWATREYYNNRNNSIAFSSYYQNIRIKTDSTGKTSGEINFKYHGTNPIKSMKKSYIYNDSINHNNLKINVEYNSNPVQDTIHVWFDSIKDVVVNKSDIIEDVINEILRAGKCNDFCERINTNLLDSILSSEIKKYGINTEYEYAIFDVFNMPVFGKFHDFLSLLKSKYYAKLYPNDVFSTSYYIKINFPAQKKYVLQKSWVILVLSAIFILLIILVFYFSIRTIIKQKQLSDVKTDFVNNMTHELKTPISTIGIACEALGDPDVSSSNESRNSFLGIIKDENKRLSLMVEKVLQNAVYEMSKFKLNTELEDIHLLLNNAIDKIEIQVRQRQGEIAKNLTAKSTMLLVDKLHMTNVFTNILDNANKYSPEQPKIIVTTYNDENGIYISIKDNGVGISKENQKKVFDKFYRVPTGNVHDVKGFGLGLSYAFNIVQRHNGTINVKSEKGQGSEFIIYLPIEI